MSFHKIGIIGLGLMGGSIFKALDGKKEISTGDFLLENLEDLDALILAVPIHAILEIGEKIATRAKSLSRPLAVLDIGSVKGEIAKRFESFTNEKIEFVATHPMAGKHQSGFEHSDADLFKEAPWIVTPHAKNTELVLEKVEELIRLLGARPLRMPAEDHDWRAALVSHVPYLISKALLDFVTAAEPQSLEMAGPGFRSMTRLAKDNPVLRDQIALYNEAHIGNTLKRFIEFLEDAR